MQRPSTVPSRTLRAANSVAVALGVVGHGAAFSGLRGQAGLGAVERLDLALLVDRRHHGMGRRVHVEADNVLDLLGEGGAVGLLEGAVGLEAMGVPEALSRAKRNAGRLGRRPPGPVGRFAGRFRARRRQYPGHRFHRQRRLARPAGLVPEQTLHPRFGEAALPAPHRRPADAGAPRHFGNRQSIRRMKHNPRPLNMLQRPAPITDDSGQSRPVLGSYNHTNIRGQDPRFARLTPCVNQ
jgi:hypothetical protein